MATDSHHFIPETAGHVVLTWQKPNELAFVIFSEMWHLKLDWLNTACTVHSRHEGSFGIIWPGFWPQQWKAIYLTLTTASITHLKTSAWRNVKPFLIIVWWWLTSLDCIAFLLLSPLFSVAVLLNYLSFGFQFMDDNLTILLLLLYNPVVLT